MHQNDITPVCFKFTLKWKVKISTVSISKSKHGLSMYISPDYLVAVASPRGGQGGHVPPLENLVPPVCPPHLRFLHLSLHLSLSSGAPHQTAVPPLCPPRIKSLVTPLLSWTFPFTCQILILAQVCFLSSTKPGSCIGIKFEIILLLWTKEMLGKK